MSGTSPLGGGRFERHCDAVHAIAQAGHRRAVIEHVAEMTAAAGAMHRRPDHAERGVLCRADHIVAQRRPETRPPGAAFEFGLRREDSLGRNRHRRKSPHDVRSRGGWRRAVRCCSGAARRIVPASATGATRRRYASPETSPSARRPRSIRALPTTPPTLPSRHRSAPYVASTLQNSFCACMAGVSDF